MEKFTAEGIVVNAIPFRNYDCILTLFTPSEGLVKFFYRGAYSKKKEMDRAPQLPFRSLKSSILRGVVIFTYVPRSLLLTII